MDASRQQMLTIEKCRKLLGDKYAELTDEQIAKMRDILTELLSEKINNLKNRKDETSRVDVQSIK